MSSVAEVVVRFGATLLDVRHVRPGGCFRIGTAADVDLAVEGARSFPLVDTTAAGFVVRVPAGVVAACAGERVTGEHRLDDRALEVQLGRVAVRIACVPDAALALARPELDRRPPAYHAVSLVAHVALWAIAIVFAAPERRHRPTPIVVTRPRVAHIAAPKPPPPRPQPKPEPKPEPHSKRGADPQIAANVAPARETGLAPAAPGERSQGANIAASFARLAKVMDDIHVTDRLAEVGPLYDPDGDHPGDFGKARAFDPTARKDFETIKTGRFATVDTGAAAGANYTIQGEHERTHVRLCDGACVAIGALQRDEIDSRIGYKKHQLADCYRTGIPDELRFTLDIDEHGVVTDTRVPGPIGSCIAKVIAKVAFPAMGSTTRVAYSLTFEPPYGPLGSHVPPAYHRPGR
jgi:hypothetical protein